MLFRFSAAYNNNFRFIYYYTWSLITRRRISRWSISCRSLAILYVAYGVKNLSKRIKVNVLKVGEDIGALGFIILAFLGLVFGGTFFKNIFYLGEPGELFSSGSIFLMNFAVGFKVFAGVSFLILIMVSSLKSKGDE